MSNTSRNVRLPLVIACIFSLIGSVGGILYGFGLSAISQFSHSEVSDILTAQGVEASSDIVGGVFAIGGLGVYFSFFNVVEIVGLVFLLLGHRLGFHVYAASQIGLAGLFVMAFGLAGSLTFIVWNLLWVLIYLRLTRLAFDNGQGRSR